MSILLVVFCASVGAHFALGDNTLNNFLFNGDYEFIDLTYPFDNSTIYWVNVKPFSFTKKIGESKPDGSWYAVNEFEAGEHGGTHIDAPYHFSRSGQFVDELPIEKLIVPLIIVDVSTQVNDNPNFVLHKQHLDYLLNDNFGKPCLIIFKFGWSKFYLDKEKYMGQNENGINFPGLSVEIADWIVNSHKNVVGVGLDLPSVDPGASIDFAAHKILQEAGLYILENVKLLQTIPEYGCTALVLPMKIAMGSGAPLRLVAICPKQIQTHF